MLGAKGTKRSRPLPTASKLPDHHFERLKKERKFIWGNPVDTESEDSESRHTRSKGNAGPVDFKAYESCVVDGKEYVAGGFVLVSDDKKESVLQIEFMGEVDGKCTLRGQLLADVEDIKHNQIRTWLAKWDSTLTDQNERFCRNVPKADEVPISEIVGSCTVLNQEDFKKAVRKNKGEVPKAHFYVKRCLLKAFNGAPISQIDFKLFLKGPTWRIKKDEEELTAGKVVKAAKPAPVSKPKVSKPAKSPKPSLTKPKENRGAGGADDEAEPSSGEEYDHEEEVSSEEEEESESEEEEEEESSASEASDVSDEGAAKKESKAKRAAPKKKRKLAHVDADEGATASPRTPANRKGPKKRPASASAARSLKMEARSAPRSEPATPFEKAREALHVAAVPKALPCREREFDEIESYVEEAISDGSGSCIYVSGVPGNGKTATVTRVIDSLREKSDAGDLDPFTCVEINGMKLLDPSQAYVILWESISGERLSAKHAAEMLERKFSRSSAQNRPIVVIMDELDLMVTQKHTVMYNFFDWPTREQSQLIVIAIANTMDLPERMLNNRVASRIAMKRITFQPYTIPQLKTIIRSRLEGVELFEDSAIEFCARKVASVSGDARRALDICRRAVEIADASVKGDMSKMKGKINIHNIMNTFNEMYASANVSFVKHAALQQKLFLIAVATRIRRSGLHEVPFHEVKEEHIRLCQLHKFDVPNGSQLSAICSNLGASRAIAVDDVRLDLYRAIRLVLSEQDVYHALQEDQRLRNCLPQDLQAAWN